MNKFTKKITKISKNSRGALVIGCGMGNLSAIVNLFRNVFLFSHTRPEEKFKNLIFKEDLKNLESLTDIDFIFIDRKFLRYLNDLIPVWNRCRPIIIIEGMEVIDRKTSEFLYRDGFRATKQDKILHVWTRQ